jgi:hypothetical protein
MADSVEKVAAHPRCRQNFSVSERGGEQHDGTATEWKQRLAKLLPHGPPLTV